MTTTSPGRARRASRVGSSLDAGGAVQARQRWFVTGPSQGGQAHDAMLPCDWCDSWDLARRVRRRRLSARPRGGLEQLAGVRLGGRRLLLAREHPGQLAQPAGLVERHDAAAGHDAVVGLAHDQVLVGEGGDLRQVGHDDDLGGAGQRGQPAARPRPRPAHRRRRRPRRRPAWAPGRCRRGRPRSRASPGRARRPTPLAAAAAPVHRRAGRSSSSTSSTPWRW